MALLDGDISALFGSVFSGIYLDGTLTRVTLVDDGEGGYTQTPIDNPCKVQIDACTERQKLELGYSAHDVRLLVLQAGLSEIRNGDIVTVRGVGYTVGPTITMDPAASYWEARGIPT